MKLHGWDFWHAIGSPRFVTAPMVDQSELPFRMLTRSLGAHLCYTPMLHSRIFLEHPTYRALHFDPHPRDRPCFAQLAGHDPDVVVRAAAFLEEEVDAIDLNFGCPQGIARKGMYGAWTPDPPALVAALHARSSVPVTAKIRLQPTLRETLDLVARLEQAGASAICVHGRRREQNKQHAGAANWQDIAAVVEASSVPIIANGGMALADDVTACLHRTGAAAAMSSEALLENPALFIANRFCNGDAGGDDAGGDAGGGAGSKYVDQDGLASLYLQACRYFEPSVESRYEGPARLKRLGEARSHLFKILYAGLREHTDVRDALLDAKCLDDLSKVDK